MPTPTILDRCRVSSLAQAALSAAVASTLTVGCDDGARARSEVETPDFGGPADQGAAGGSQVDQGASGGAIGSDAADRTDARPAPADVGTGGAGGGGLVDGGPTGGMPPDAGPTGGQVPDAAAGPPEVCNGEDEDLDGRIDEGVANLCGGCGGLPPEGCQSWRVDMTQTAAEAQTLNPNRLVGLQGSVTSTAERDIEGARCLFQRSLGATPDAHVGIVTLTTPLRSLLQVPVYDGLSRTIRYDASPESGPVQLFADGDEIQVQAGGGQLVGAFEATLPAPRRITGLGDGELQGAIDVLRGVRAEPVTLHWAPGAGGADGALRFFVGGSRSQFNRGGLYRGITYYQLDAQLVDDGALEVGPELSRFMLADSSIWVYLRRENVRRIILGPHAVELSAASRAEQRASGNLEAQDPPSFDILAPSPDVRRVTPGEPLEVRWTEPPGEGPLVVSLVFGDAEGVETTYVACEVAEPASGRLVLPAEATLGWPAGPEATRLLSVRRDLATVDLPGPDRGRITYSVSLMLALEP
jgi:hypothetical protein